MRFWNSRPLILRGLNSVGIGFPSGCGSTAVPEGGTCAGVKYGVAGAGLFTTLGMLEAMVCWCRQAVVVEEDVELLDHRMCIKEHE